MELLIVSKAVVLIIIVSCCYCDPLTIYGSDNWKKIYLSVEEVQGTSIVFKGDIKIINVDMDFKDYGRVCKTNSGQQTGVLIHYHRCEKIMLNVEYKLTRTLWLDTERKNDTSYYRMICCVVHDIPLLLREIRNEKEMLRRKNGGGSCNTGIYNGHEQNVSEFPYMCAVLNENDEHFCGGSLITENFVLTAAHCILSTPQWVRFGNPEDSSVKCCDDNAIDKSRCNNNCRKFNVTCKTKHQNYKISPDHFDIGLVRLEKNVGLTLDILPVKLTQNISNTIHPEYNILGWGYLNHDLFESSKVLLRATVYPKSLHSEDYCDKPKGSNTTFICAGGSSNACTGDSGGPLIVISKTNCHTLCGIAIHGAPCGGRDSSVTFLIITPFIGWINNHIWPDTINLID